MDEPKNKRASIRDLQIDRASRGNGDGYKRRMPRVNNSNTNALKHGESKKRKKSGLFWFLLIGILFILALVVSIPTIFSDTTIRIKPVVTKATFNDAIFNAFLKNSQSDTNDGLNTLNYSVVEWDSTDKVDLEPTGREQVKEKASGVITVYNNFTKNKQRLIKNTRFETSDGHVYRVRESIVVPGKTSGAPGTLDVRVYADEAGESYNIQSGSLTLPGLKSLPDMYTNIYAKVKSPITGGFDGERAVVSQESKSSASATLRNKIKKEVLTEIKNRIPEDTRYFDSGVYIEFADTSESEIGGKVQIVENAKVKVIVFDKVELARVLSASVAGNPDKGYPTIKDPSKLSVEIVQKTTDDSDADSVKLIVNGDADFVWMFDKQNLIKDLAGKQKDALLTILTGYPTIDKAEAIIRPFWRKTFPKNAKDFTIEILPTP